MAAAAAAGDARVERAAACCVGGGGGGRDRGRVSRAGRGEASRWVCGAAWVRAGQGARGPGVVGGGAGAVID